MFRSPSKTSSVLTEPLGAIGEIVGAFKDGQNTYFNHMDGSTTSNIEPSLD
jgi:hypothetical protein